MLDPVPIATVPHRARSAYPNSAHGGGRRALHPNLVEYLLELGVGLDDGRRATCLA
jgi:hypothetical protein